MERVIISNYDEYGDPVDGVGVSGNSVLPIDVQARLQTTIQTHNAVSVGASGSSGGSWIDCDGYSDIAISLINDASTTNYANLDWSHDGSTTHATEVAFIPSNTTQKKIALTQVKARYAKVIVANGDTVSHTMSAWAYLKV